MTAENIHNIEETTLLGGRLRLLQPKVGFRAGTDTVFLAAAVPVADGWNVLDVGCGVGSAGLCVALKKQNIKLTGLDIQPDLIDVARRNADLNGVTDRCRFVSGDIATEMTIENNNFKSVLMNPPYQESGTHTPSPVANRALSHGEDASGSNLIDWIKFAHQKLENGYYLTVIHRADRLDDLVNALTARRWFGSLVIYPLYPHAGESARRVIVRARKERYAPLVLKSGMVLHEADGSYTESARAVLKEGAAIGMD